MKIENLLTELEKNKLALFSEDKVMFDAVKKVLLAGIYSNGTIKKGEELDTNVNFALSLLLTPNGQEVHQDNELLGARLRASVEGLRFLEVGFKTLESLGVKEVKSEKNKNPAR